MNISSSVSLELLRQEKSIISVSAKAKHFHNPELAERQFRSESVRTRSKFDREVGKSSSSIVLLPPSTSQFASNALTLSLA